MKIETFPLGLFGANCYLLSDGQKNAVLIDPADSTPMLRYLQKNDLTLRYILLTHGHFDHIWGVADLTKQTDAKVVCHAADQELLENPNLAAGAFGDLSCPPCRADITVQGGESLGVGEMVFAFLHTPGHSKGSMCIRCKNVLFSGDTLFAGSVGRTDLYGGSMDTLMTSLKKLIALPDDTVVYPGHGEKSILGNEKRRNIYLVRAAGGAQGVGYDDLF